MIKLQKTVCYVAWNALFTTKAVTLNPQHYLDKCINTRKSFYKKIYISKYNAILSILSGPPQNWVSHMRPAGCVVTWQWGIFGNCLFISRRCMHCRSHAPSRSDRIGWFGIDGMSRKESCLCHTSRYSIGRKKVTTKENQTLTASYRIRVTVGLNKEICFYNYFRVAKHFCQIRNVKSVSMIFVLQ